MSKLRTVVLYIPLFKFFPISLFTTNEFFCKVQSSAVNLVAFHHCPFNLHSSCIPFLIYSTSNLFHIPVLILITGSCSAARLTWLEAHLLLLTADILLTGPEHIAV